MWQGNSALLPLLLPLLSIIIVGPVWFFGLWAHVNEHMHLHVYYRWLFVTKIFEEKKIDMIIILVKFCILKDYSAVSVSHE